MLFLFFLFLSYPMIQPMFILRPWASPRKWDLHTHFFSAESNSLALWQGFWGQKGNSVRHLCFIFLLCYWLHSACSWLLLLAFFFFSDCFLDSTFVFFYTIDQFDLTSLLFLKLWLSFSSCYYLSDFPYSAFKFFKRERKKLVGWLVAIQGKWSLLIHLKFVHWLDTGLLNNYSKSGSLVKC